MHLSTSQKVLNTVNANLEATQIGGHLLGSQGLEDVFQGDREVQGHLAAHILDTCILILCHWHWRQNRLRHLSTSQELLNTVNAELEAKLKNTIAEKENESSNAASLAVDKK